MNKFIFILFFIIISAAAILPAQAETSTTCAPTSTQEIAALFDHWNAALVALDLDKVVALYAPEAVLLPTLSNKPRSNHEEIRDYFVHFLEKKPHGKIDFSIIKIGCNVASNTGLYSFTVYDKKGRAKNVPGRFSFVYEYLNGQWLIEHHHSSAMPKPVKGK